MLIGIRQYVDEMEVDCSWWIVPEGYALHVLTFDVLITGCNRVEYVYY